jgi:sugar-specific transcriptional regulator TrmB
METHMEKPGTVIKLYDQNTGAWKIVRKDKGPQKSLEIIENALRKLGLSKNEIKIYIHLARTGERKASEISEALSLHRTETYRILRDLEKRGLVSSVFEKPLKFIATPFEKALEILIETRKLKIQLLEKKKKTLVDLWGALPKQRLKVERKEVFQILEGEEQISLKASEILENTEKEVIVFASDDDLARLYHSGFLDKLERVAKKRLKVRLLTNYSPKSCFFIEKTKLANVKYSVVGVDELPCFIVSDGEQLLLLIRNNGGKRRIAALWTNYSAFLKTLSVLFNELWEHESPLNMPEIPITKP